MIDRELNQLENQIFEQQKKKSNYHDKQHVGGNRQEKKVQITLFMVRRLLTVADQKESSCYRMCFFS
jgi:hypothetical protein